MDEIHVSWHGSVKPGPRDLSKLLSVRPCKVKAALVWLKRHNPLYRNISINVEELESWEVPSHGVPPQVYDRLERNEPSAREKIQTAHVVPPIERGLEDAGPTDIREILASLEDGEKECNGADAIDQTAAMTGLLEEQDTDPDPDTICEISSSGMFGVDDGPNIADGEKLRYVCEAVKGPEGGARK
ncbi:hypothetical protein NW754_002236 [Fusarium falciforme]|nr:hypothetical protein NW754_002236 [Fusarium falciforme]